MRIKVRTALLFAFSIPRAASRCNRQSHYRQAKAFRFRASGKNHLKKLSLNKTATFELRKIVKNANIAKVLIDSIDLSQQILLDGAAWYSLPEKDEQKREEQEIYQKLEQQAKTDKRGIWNFPDLKPLWVINAEIEAEKEEQRILAMMKQNSLDADRRQKEREKANTTSKIWTDIPNVPQGRTQSIAPRKMISILQMTSNFKSYIGVTLQFTVVIEISTLYFGVYRDAQESYYAFRISDGSDSTLVYMKRGERAESLREQLLQSGKGVGGRASVTLFIEPESQSGSSVYPEMVNYGPADPLK